jgi:nicotinamidase-related amidase
VDESARELLVASHPALVVIDEQRRHLDPQLAYHPVPPADAARVLRQTAAAVAGARARGMPVVHVKTFCRQPYRGEHVDLRNPFWSRQRTIPGSGVPRQRTRNEEGSAYQEIMPEVAPRDNEPVVVKRRYSAFFATDLDVVLRGLGADAVVLAGVNTNNCVMATAFDAHARDYAVFVLADACGSMNGGDYHQWALRQIEAAIGWTLTTDEFLTVVSGQQTA